MDGLINQMQIQLRLLSHDDAPIAARIHVDAWRAAYCGLVPDEFLMSMSYANREESFRQAIAAREAEMYLVVNNGLPAGLLTIGACRDADMDACSTGEIWGIYLLPEFWRQGIGTALVDRAEEILSGYGFTQVVLWVFEGNANARRFYEVMGYAVDGAEKSLNPGKILNAIRYRKTLAPDSN